MPIPTVQSVVRTGRRLDRLNRKVEQVVELMRAGAALHASHGSKSMHWWLSTGGVAVHGDVARLVIERGDIAGVGDCLFDSEPSQTFRYIG
jgi:hypothetical protein